MRWIESHLASAVAMLSGVRMSAASIMVSGVRRAISQLFVRPLHIPQLIAIMKSTPAPETKPMPANPQDQISALNTKADILTKELEKAQERIRTLELAQKKDDARKEFLRMEEGLFDLNSRKSGLPSYERVV